MHTLIPEQRGDVLGLLESTDKVLNSCKAVLFQFAVERPDIPEEYKQDYTDLADTSISAVECMISAVRAYFSEFQMVRDNINKTLFFEKESDKLADKLKRSIFANDKLDLSAKMHIRYFVYHIDQIADAAEDVCDRLSIAVIKRYG
jgi:predicted phosphate transport protein (TIGR00153 family)